MSPESCKVVEQVGLEISTDASFAPTGKRSPLGMLIQIFGVSVAWRASRTHLIAQSVCEAELVAIHEGFLLAARIRELLFSLGFVTSQFVFLVR